MLEKGPTRSTPSSLGCSLCVKENPLPCMRITGSQETPVLRGGGGEVWPANSSVRYSILGSSPHGRPRSDGGKRMIFVLT